MRRGLLFASAAIVIGAMGGGTAMAMPAPSGGSAVPATQRVMMGIGCTVGTGTCATTEYWLGKAAGADTVGSVATATPIEYVFTAAGEGSEFAVFSADDSLEPSYTLRADEPIRGQVTLGKYRGEAPQFGADSTVEVVLTASRVSNSQTVDFGTATINKQVVTPDEAGTVYSYSLPIAADLDGVKVKDLSLTLYVRGINAMQNGFVDGEGGSWFDLPHSK